jgi:hypothetical protein
MNTTLARQRLLKIFLIICGVATALHFTDNYLYIEQYPQPDWITAPSIYQAWLVWTSIGIAGYWLYKQQQFWLAYLCLAVYSCCGLDSLGHYLYGAMADFSLKMHGLIVMDGVAGAAVLGFVLWSSLVWREFLGTSDSSH